MEAEEKAEFRTQLESQRNSARERQAELKAENEALKTDMNQLKERIDTLKFAEGASCPLCGQQLSEEHRALHPPTARGGRQSRKATGIALT